MSVRSLLINGLAIPLHAALDITQSYTPLQASSRTRTRDGSLKPRTVWRGKVSTTISASGTIPPGLQGLDFGQPITLGCIEHDAITVDAPTTAVALPSKRRTDAGSTPYGRALLMMGSVPNWVSTPVSMAGDTANITPVASAVQYQVVWFPELVVWADPPTQTKEGHGPGFRWQLTAEEM